MSVKQLIEDSYAIGDLGAKMKAALDKKNAAEKTEPSFEDKFESQVKNVGSLSKGDNLLSIDYGSWFLLSPRTREYISRVLTPLFVGGVYLDYSLFCEKEDEIVKTFVGDESCMISYSPTEKYKMLVASAEGSHADYLSDRKLAAFRIDCQKNLVRTIGWDSQKKVKKEFLFENLEDGTYTVKEVCHESAISDSTS